MFFEMKSECGLSEGMGFACSAVFRKMFPEYVEKHLERQRAAEQAASEKAKLKVNETLTVLETTNVQSSSARPAMNGNIEVKGRQQRPSHKFPFWLTAVIVAVFASIMALPLLTLDLAHT